MPKTERQSRPTHSFAGFFRHRLLPELAAFERVRRRRLPFLAGLTALCLLAAFYLLSLCLPHFRAAIAILGALSMLIILSSFAVARFLPSLLYRGTGIRANASYRVAALIVPIKVLETFFGGVGALDQLLFRNASRRLDFSRRVTAPTVGFALPGLAHRPVEYLGQGDFLESRLYGYALGRYSGRDYFYGRPGGLDFRFSWLAADLLPESNPGNRRNPQFKGWFFAVGFGKRFAGEILVRPDVAEAALGWLGRSMQGLLTPPDMHLVHLEDAEFEQRFEVYASGQIEARYVLTPVLMRAFTALRRRLDGPLAVSFRGDRLYAAIPAPVEYFGLLPVRPFTDPRFARHLYHAVKGVAGLADDVARNHRLWREELDAFRGA